MTLSLKHPYLLTLPLIGVRDSLFSVFPQQIPSFAQEINISHMCDSIISCSLARMSIEKLIF
jgi:hypothetical protein